MLILIPFEHLNIDQALALRSEKWRGCRFELVEGVGVFKQPYMRVMWAFFVNKDRAIHISSFKNAGVEIDDQDAWAGENEFTQFLVRVDRKPVVRRDDSQCSLVCQKPVPFFDEQRVECCRALKIDHFLRVVRAENWPGNPSTLPAF